MAPLTIHSIKILKSIDVFLVFLSEVYCKIWLHFSVFQVMSESFSNHNKTVSLLLVQIYLQYNSERARELGGKYQLPFLRWGRHEMQCSEEPLSKKSFWKAREMRKSIKFGDHCLGDVKMEYMWVFSVCLVNTWRLLTGLPNSMAMEP